MTYLRFPMLGSCVLQATPLPLLYDLCKIIWMCALICVLIIFFLLLLFLKVDLCGDSFGKDCMNPALSNSDLSFLQPMLVTETKWNDYAMTDDDNLTQDIGGLFQANANQSINQSISFCGASIFMSMVHQLFGVLLYDKFCMPL